MKNARKSKKTVVVNKGALRLNLFSAIRSEKIIQAKINGLINIVNTYFYPLSPKIDPIIIRDFVRIFYLDLIKYVGQPDQEKQLKLEIHNRGKIWLFNQGVRVPESWGVATVSGLKILKGVDSKIKSKKLRIKVAAFKSTPTNSGKRKKINKEMDKILKKIEETKALNGDQPRKKLNERIRIVSGGLPGLGKRR
jgi:hypothetical protein